MLVRVSLHPAARCLARSEAGRRWAGRPKPFRRAHGKCKLDRGLHTHFVVDSRGAGSYGEIGEDYDPETPLIPRTQMPSPASFPNWSSSLEFFGTG